MGCGLDDVATGIGREKATKMSMREGHRGTSSRVDPFAEGCARILLADELEGRVGSLEVGSPRRTQKKKK